MNETTPSPPPKDTGGGEATLSKGLILLTGTLAALIFVTDLLLPLGAAGAVPYVVVVMTGWWYPGGKLVLLRLAALSSILTLAGFVFSPAGGVIWVVLLNRLYALFAIWAAAVILIIAKTSRNSLEKQTFELKKLTLAVEQSPISVVITDLDGTIEYVNSTFSDLTGFSSEEVIGQTPRVLKSGLLPAALYKDLWDTISRGESWHEEILNRKKKW
ncbi:MAG: PAS domain S-box protein [Magnetococcales bacterium]|nr:PAS domain S-box protein [Magnetococcales bacterium]